jgi:hypothetical protein
MLRKSALIAVLTVIIPVASVQGQRPLNPSTGRDFLEACDASGELDVVFVGRLEDPVTFRISGEEEIEKARQDWIRAEAEMARLNASQDVKTGFERDRELAMAIAVIRAQEEFNYRRAMYPEPYDLTLFPVIVEQAFRGVTEPTLMLRSLNPSLRMEPGERYLITGIRTTKHVAALFEDGESSSRGRLRGRGKRDGCRVGTAGTAIFCRDCAGWDDPRHA